MSWVTRSTTSSMQRLVKSLDSRTIIMKSSEQTRQAKSRANIIKGCASNTTVTSIRILKNNFHPKTAKRIPTFC
jgi:hypothetical protein